MTKILWALPFPSSWGGNIQLVQLPKRNLTLNVEADEQTDLQILFEQVEAYKCTFYFARTEEMLIAYDRIVDLGETSWLVEIRNRMREHPDLSSPSGPPDQLLHLMINFDDGPCYEFICQKFGVAQTPTDPERWKVR